MTSRSVALILGIIFIVVGLLGFVSNPIIGGEGAIFHSDLVHNFVHIITGAVFIITAVVMPGNTAMLLKVFGIVYFLLGVWGITAMGDDGMAYLLGILHVNVNDNYLHLALGVVIFIGGMLRNKPVTAA